ncbi:hypothetical protein DFH06DRAFT_1476658 [Mycena polygramma]|nr:hypothetical protein DFH06DRAFT_1476658 [Mycena polygramma]
MVQARTQTYDLTFVYPWYPTRKTSGIAKGHLSMTADKVLVEEDHLPKTLRVDVQPPDHGVPKQLCSHLVNGNADGIGGKSYKPKRGPLAEQEFVQEGTEGKLRNAFELDKRTFRWDVAAESFETKEVTVSGKTVTKPISGLKVSATLVECITPGRPIAQVNVLSEASEARVTLFPDEVKNKQGGIPTRDLIIEILGSAMELGHIPRVSRSRRAPPRSRTRASRRPVHTARPYVQFSRTHTRRLSLRLTMSSFLTHRLLAHHLLLNLTLSVFLAYTPTPTSTLPQQVFAVLTNAPRLFGRDNTIRVGPARAIKTALRRVLWLCSPPLPPPFPSPLPHRHLERTPAFVRFATPKGCRSPVKGLFALPLTSVSATTLFVSASASASACVSPIRVPLLPPAAAGSLGAAHTIVQDCDGDLDSLRTPVPGDASLPTTARPWAAFKSAAYDAFEAGMAMSIRLPATSRPCGDGTGVDEGEERERGRGRERVWGIQLDIQLPDSLPPPPVPHELACETPVAVREGRETLAPFDFAGYQPEMMRLFDANYRHGAATVPACQSAPSLALTLALHSHIFYTRRRL